MSPTPHRETLSSSPPVKARSPVKMAGGKRKLVPELLKRLPLNKFDADHSYYHEPFMGGAALFFAMQPKKAFLSDANIHLVYTFIAIKDDVERVIQKLRSKRYASNVDSYYRIRETAFCSGRGKLVTDKYFSTASDFIYLNRTCFNGLWRVNQAGKFNVPFGKYDNPTICDAVNLRACSKALRNAHIKTADFNGVLVNARRGDIIYFDPPYWPKSETANFRAYTANGFGPDQQAKLRDVAIELKKRGVFVLLSNADVAPVRELYKKGFTIDRIQAARNINADGAGRGKVGELLIY